MEIINKIKLWFDTKIIKEQILILEKEKKQLYANIDERQKYLKILKNDIKDKKDEFDKVKTEWEKTHTEIESFLSNMYDKNEIKQSYMYEDKFLGLRVSVWLVIVVGSFIIAYAWYANMLNMVLPIEWQHVIDATLNATNETLVNTTSNTLNLNGVKS